MQHITTPRRATAMSVALYALLAVATLSLFLAYGTTVKAAVGPSVAVNIANSGNTIVTTANVGSLLHASTTVSSGTTTIPTGNVTFLRYNNTSCSSTSSTQVVALTAAGAISPATTIGVNGLSYIVSYAGDASTTAATSSCMSVTAQSSTTTIATTLSTTSIMAGANATDSAALSQATASAGGSVTYNVYSNAACTALFGSGGMHTVSSGIVPNSNAVAFPTAGTYYWQAIYSGDANNSAATSSCMSEILTVNPIVVPPGMATTTLTNTLSTTSIMVGGTAFDTAFLTNSTSSATGTVAYTVYTDSACTAGALNVGTKNVTGGIVPSSNVSLFNATGTYYYRAVYIGDAHNTAASTTCGAAILTVSAAPLPPIMMATTTLTNTLSTTSIMVGGTAYDTAILSNSTSSAGGTVNYSIYSDSSCNVLLQNVGSKTVTAGMVPNSNTASFGFPGTYYWRAVYSGDPHNTGATTTCGAAILTVLAMGSTTPPVAGAGSISGVIFNDLNKDEERDAGENGLSGWTVHLLKVVRHHHWKWHNKHWNDMWTESTTTHMTTISDANGYYVFPNLTPGKYVVSEDVMSNWEQTTELDPVIVTATSAETVDIGNVQKKMHHQGWWWGSGQWHNGDEDSSNNDESDNNGDSNNNNQWEWQTTYGGKFPFQSHAFDWFMGRSNQ